MVNNFTNIIKANNDPSPQLIEHKNIVKNESLSPDLEILFAIGNMVNPSTIHETVTFYICMNTFSYQNGAKEMIRF